MDFIFTIVMIYLAYRGYQWYQRVQAQVKGGPPPNPNIDGTVPEDRDDYIDYEEVK